MKSPLSAKRPDRWANQATTASTAKPKALYKYILGMAALNIS